MVGLTAASVGWYLWAPTIFGLVTALIVVLLGLRAVRSSATISAIIAEVVSHTVGCLALFVGIYHFVPRCEKAFAESGAELPGITHLLMRVSDAFVLHWFFLLPLLLALLAADATIFGVLHHNESTRTKAKLWSGCITGFILIAILLAVVAVAGPSKTLWNELR